VSLPTENRVVKLKFHAYESAQNQGQVNSFSPSINSKQIYKLQKITIMTKDKDSAATDAAIEQDVRQYLDTEVEQPRQAPQSEPAASDTS
jgi:hypothetical protein